NDNEGGLEADKTLKMHKLTTNAVIKDTFGLRRIIPNVEKLGNTTPTAYKLEQNYPNPFNPETVISWQIAVGSFVTLKVYDVLGNEVAALVNEEQSAGTYQILFNTLLTTNNKQLTSGVYFYQIRAGNFVQTKKMILLR
ncbi:MAG: T9SS type A sorting domain-containing protein, partial [Ignavibacteria bacterium]|nr:T9SS type A sorting domain-containing protein [Ignavibacteria bacterium]